MSISKNQIKNIIALHSKKNRKEEGLFFVEGEKIAEEVISQSRFTIDAIYATENWIDDHEEVLSKSSFTVYECNENELKKISALTNPNKVLVVLKLNENKFIEPVHTSILLDNIQDPGNLGSIIRIADWFGIENIYCSEDSAEFTNPKVLQSSMGSFLRVNVNYVNLKEFLLQYSDFPCYAAVLNGKDVRQVAISERCFLLIGNESKGISSELVDLDLLKISIPRFGAAESLNAAVATGILCAMIKN